MDSNLLKTLLNLAVNLFTGNKQISVEIPIGSSLPTTPQAMPTSQASSAKKISIIRSRFCPEGIFGEMKDSDGSHICYTLEHSYDNVPKVAPGTYQCKRGPHRLHGMTEDFITFEVMGVPDFQGNPVRGILYHWGNYDRDSNGCFLLGNSETPTMVGNSKEAFSGFMKLMDGLDSFEVTIS